MIYAPHVLSKSPELPDLTAARARIAELDSMLDRSCSAYQDDIEKLNARIAELEDWQRRAVGTGLLDEHNGCQCRTCRDVTQLLSEAKP